MKTRAVLTALLVLALLQPLAAGPGLAQGPGTPPDKGAAPQAVTPPDGQLVDVWWFEQKKPAVAMGDGQALVVWEDTRPGDGAYQAIYARYTNPAGAVLGLPFALSYLAFLDGPRKTPDVAYNPQSGKYLAVWEWADAFNPDIYGHIIDKTGFGYGESFVAGSESGEHNPAVAANTTDGEFLVVYELHVGDPEFGRHDIYAIRINAWTGFAVGSAFAVDTIAASHRNPAVAYDADHNQYLVVWEEYTSSGCVSGCYNIMARRVAANGTLQGDRISPGLFAASKDYPATPAVTYNPAADEFMIVWTDHDFGAATDWNIFGRPVDSDGAVLSLVIVAGGTAGDVINRLSPSVSYDAFANECLVCYEFVFSSSDHDVKCRRVAANSELAGSEIYLSTFASWESAPDVASTGYGGYLVVWEDNRMNATLATGMDIFDTGVYVRYPAFLPLVRKSG